MRKYIGEIKLIQDGASWKYMFSMFFILIFLIDFMKSSLFITVSLNTNYIYIINRVLSTEQQVKRGEIRAIEKNLINLTAHNTNLSNEVYSRLSMVYDYMGETDKAMHYYEKVSTSTNISLPIRANALIKLAQYNFMCKNYQKTIQFADAVLDLATESSMVPASILGLAYMYQGKVAYEMNGNLDLTRAYFEKALRYYWKKGIISNYLQLVSLYLVIGDEASLKKAYEVASRAYEFIPNNPWVSFNLCRVQISRENYVDAESWCREAIALDANNEQAKLWLGINYYHQEKWLAAKGEFQKLVEMAPDNDRYLIWLEKTEEVILEVNQ